MKSIILLCFSFCYCTSFSQQVYEINFKLAGNAVHSGILVRNKNNTGFIRLKAANGVIHDLEWKAEQLYDRDQNKYFGPAIYHAATKDSFLYSKAKSQRAITGQLSPAIKSIVIWFKRNKANGLFEPYTGVLPFGTTDHGRYGEWEMVSLKAPSTKQAGAFNGDPNSLASAKKQSAKTLEKKWLQSFFSPGELAGKTGFTANQLLTTRKENKPVFYLVAMNANERICKEDVESLTAYFGELTAFMDIGYKKIYISGTDFNVKGLRRTIGSLKVKDNDIILFTYSGHGFSFREDEQHPFPQLALWKGDAPSQDFLRNNTINLEEVYTMILAKKARLNIVMGDCCNSYVEMKRVHGVPQGEGMFPPPGKDWDMYKISRLFLESSQSHLFAAAQKGEMAGSHVWFGGFLTYNFLHRLNDAIQEKQPGEPDWAAILEKTKARTFEHSKQYLCGGGLCGQRMISKMGN